MNGHASMNRAFRLVWSEVRQAWVAVPECARGKGKSSAGTVFAPLLAAGVLCLSLATQAQVMPATTVLPTGGNTNAYLAPNGVPVVNINTANAAGLSHNRYTRYDVENKGLVLNNGNAAQAARQSQLAGQVMANVNLAAEARVILNEVVSTSRSTLAGFTEVLGRRADVVVANPNGITCSGCGFINTDRVTLTTGTPNLSGDGSLAGFTVNRGDLLINGNGFNATAQQILDLVARSVKVDGQINAATLGIITGANQWSYTTREVTGSASASDATPAYSLDSTALGGMYAGRIRIIATEAGVGVRMLGQAAASADDFTLTSAGRIVLQSAVSAARDASLASTAASGSEDIFLDGAGAKFSASRDLSLTATGGQIRVSEGELYAANNLALTAGTLSDVSTGARTRFAGASNTLTVSGAASIDGADWGAGGTLSGTFDSLVIGPGGATIRAGSTLVLTTTNDLSLGTALVRSPGNLSLTASAGTISTSAGAAQGVQSTAGNLNLSAGNGLTNAGTVTADAGSVTVRIDGALTNSGTLHAATTLDIADQNGGSSENVSNSGTLLADDALVVQANAFTNTGAIQGTAGTTLNAATLSNSGTFLASDVAGAAATFTLSNSFDNLGSGLLQGKGAVTVTAGGAWNNSGRLFALSVANGGSAGVLQASGNTITNSGTLDAAGTLLANATGTSGITFSNSGAIQAAGAMTLNAGAALTNSGTVIGDTGIALSTGSGNFTLSNSGRIQAATLLAIGDANHTVSSLANLSAGILFGNLLDIKAGALSNAGIVQATSGATATGSSFTNSGSGSVFITSTTAGADGSLSFTGAIDNQGTLQSAGGLILTSAGALTNSGSIYVAGLSDTLAISAATISTSGYIEAGDVLSLTATGSSGTTFSNSGQIHSVDTLTVSSGGNVANATGAKLLGDADVAIASPAAAFTLTNDGRIRSGTTLTLGGYSHVLTLDNQSDGILIAGSTLSLTGGALTNAGIIQSTAGATVTGSTFTNSGSGSAFIVSTTAGDDGNMSFSGAISNLGTLQSAGGLTVNGSSTLTNNGTIYASGSSDTLAISATTLTNSGRIEASDLLNLTATSTSGTTFANSGQVHSVDAMTMASGGSVSNTGSLIGDAALTLTSSQASFVLTNAGRLQAGGALTLGGSGHLIAMTNQSAGNIYAGGSLNLTGGALSNAGTVQAMSGTALSGSTFTNTGDFLTTTSSGADGSLSFSGAINNQGTLQSAGGLTVSGASTLTNSGTVLASGDSDTLSLSATTITNSGSIDGANALNLTATSTSGATLTNSGQVHADGTLALSSGGDVSNSSAGKLLADGALSITTGQSTFDLSNAGRIQSGTTLTLGGASHLMTLTNQSAGIVFAGTTLNLRGGALDNQGKLYAYNGSTVNISSLTNGSGSNSSALIFGAIDSGTSQFTLSGALDNYGAIHSNDNLTITASGVTNRSTGGMSSLETLSVTASNDIDNYGAFYAGSQLTLRATSGNLTNYQSTGTLDSSGSMTLVAGGTFTNNNTINASQDIAITATTFRNEIPGGVPSRLWTSTSWGGTQDDGYVCNGDLCPVVPGDEWWYYKRSGSRSQYFASAIPDTKPQIIAGRNMSISGFSAAYNTGAVLSASSGTMTITGSGSFTNDDLSLVTENFTEYWHTYKDWGFFEDDWYYNQGYSMTTSTSTARSYGAGIFAGTLNASGFSLFNQSSPWTASPTSRSASSGSQTSASSVSGASGSGSGSASGVSGASGANSGSTSGVSGAGGTSAGSKNNVVAGARLSFAGLNLTLPANPNGYFVPTPSSNAQYLVETNPLFAVGSNFVGSNYLAERYGYNPDTVQKRLGDANYEAYLIKQQLIQQTGNNLIKGYGNEAAQMKRLMDQAVSQGEKLGFTFGKALTPSQVAGLKQDIVWMEEVEVAGQKVLAPRVYLAQSTRDMITGGAVIAGDNVNLNLTSLTNTGGSISGDETLKITSKGDITNTSGSISGGAVSLKSVEGSIKNETITQGSGNDEHFKTTIGKMAGITATGDLDLDARKDIKVLGADVSAGGNASLAAGGKVTFDTIVDKTTTTSRESLYLGPFHNSSSTNTTTTEKNIGSNLVVGNNLKIKSGGDTVIAGSNVATGGSLDVDTGGSFKVEARQDKVTSKTTSETSGIGVGGGLYGSETTTTDSFKGTNKGSTVEVGGDLKVKANKDMALQGSDLSVAGNADIDAKTGIKVLDGLDEERTTTKTTTNTFLKIDGDGNESGSQSKSESGSGMRKASASADASAEASSDHNLKLWEGTTTTTDSGSKTSVASNFKVGGDLKAKTDGTLTLQGSNLEVGGNAELGAKNVEVLTGRNEEWSNTNTSRTSVGFYEQSGADASTNANAQAKERGGNLGSNASASAGAEANAESTITAGVRAETEQENSYKLTNTGSTIKVGGNLNLKAKDKATFVGASVEAGGDLNIDAKYIENRAAQDIDVTTTSRTQNTAGLYVGGESNANAGAEAVAKSSPLAKSGASAETGASAEVSAGLREAFESEKTTEGSITNVTNSFKAGGNFTRTAKDTILDQGTSIEAGGDINQSARVIKEEAIHDRTFSSSDSQSHDVRVGVYAGAEANAEAGADSRGNAEADAGAEASAGFKASYKGSVAGESSSENTAVTSKYKAGGSINSKSKDGTTLVGTQFEAGKDVNIEAGSLDYQAARDSSSTSSTSHDIDAQGKVAVYGSAGFSAEANYGMENEGEKNSTARIGSLNAGGNINIKTTKGDVSFEGTNIEGKGKVTVDSAGKVEFKAAYDTSESSSKSVEASANVSVGGGEAGGGASAGYSQEDTSSRQARTGGIKGGEINVKAAGDVNLEGTKLKSAGDTSLEAGGNVNLKAAKNTESNTSFGVSVGGEFGKSDEGSNQSVEGGANADYYKGVSSDTAAIESGGKLNIKGKTVTNQEADLKSKDGANIDGKVANQKAENSVISLGIEAEGGMEKETKKQQGSKTTDDLPDNRPKAADAITKKYSAEAPEPSKKSDSDKPNTPDQRKADIEKLKAGWDQQKQDVNKALDKKTPVADTTPDAKQEPAKKGGATENPSSSTPAKPQGADKTSPKPKAKPKPGYMNDTISSSLKKTERKPTATRKP